MPRTTCRAPVELRVDALCRGSEGREKRHQGFVATDSLVRIPTLGPQFPEVTPIRVTPRKPAASDAGVSPSLPSLPGCSEYSAVYAVSQPQPRGRKGFLRKTLRNKHAPPPLPPPPAADRLSEACWLSRASLPPRSRAVRSRAARQAESRRPVRRSLPVRSVPRGSPSAPRRAVAPRRCRDASPTR